MSSRTVGGALLSVLIVALAGCDASGPDDASPDPTAETSAGTPAAEGTGAEEPVPGGGGPAIETVGLPVGGGGNAGGQRDQCVFLNWTNDDGGTTVPAGIEATVTEVVLDGGVASGGCGEAPPCVGYTFTPGSSGCSVKVTLEPGEATLSLRGQVACSLSAAECAALLGDYEGIRIEGPEPTESPSPTPSPISTPTETDEPETSSPITDEPLPTG